MNLAADTYEELSKLGVSRQEITGIKEIRHKDGIHVCRVLLGRQSYVLKYFLKGEYTREIQYYSILKDLGVPTISVVSNTDKALLLEDIDQSNTHRLGIEADLSDCEIAKSLARWYIKLHNKGTEYITTKNSKLYRELDVLTPENIKLIQHKSNTVDNKVWAYIMNHLELILRKVHSLGETLTYNDFYWTNLIVSKNKQEAMMFDYNLMGIGFRYNDVRNVCSSLSEAAQKAFLKEYGEINQEEKMIDEGISILINLAFAYQKEVFPTWGRESLDAIHNGELHKAITRILAL